jgi:hypothetical protein
LIYLDFTGLVGPVWHMIFHDASFQTGCGLGGGVVAFRFHDQSTAFNVEPVWTEQVSEWWGREYRFRFVATRPSNARCPFFSGSEEVWAATVPQNNCH